MSNEFPTDYPDKGSADATDKVWSSDGLDNFNLKVSEIGDRNFTDKTTTNLVEGTNLYYTEARVDANSTVVGKADRTNVLEKDNVTIYTPTTDYNPATKKYVDDNVAVKASDAEVATGTDDTKFVTPLTLANNYGIDREIITFTRNAASAPGTVNYLHNLGKNPRLITFDISYPAAQNVGSRGAYDGVNNRCTWNEGNVGGEESTTAIRFGNATDYTTATVTAVSTTDFTLTWANNATPSGTFYVTVILYT